MFFPAKKDATRYGKLAFTQGTGIDEEAECGRVLGTGKRGRVCSGGVDPRKCYVGVE